MLCRVCDGERFSVAIDLGMQPWGNHFLQKEEVGKEPHYPLRVVYCHACKTAQLDYTVKKEIMFSDHTYLSGVTRSLREHFARIAEEVTLRFFRASCEKTALDIGSNDGTQLKCYKELGYKVIGVESSKRTAALANAAGIPTLCAFFNKDTAQKIATPFDVINASGIFFHLEELHSVTEGIRLLLKEEGVFIVQFLYMKSIMENTAFDQIYHEHLLYYTLTTLETLLNRHNLSCFDARLAPIHGGSMIAFVSHKGHRPPSARLEELRRQEELSGCNELTAYLELAHKIQELKEKNLAYLNSSKRDGKRIYGMGAPVKGNTLLNTFGIGTALIDTLVEKNELRKGLYSPGMHIPIILEREVEEPPDIYYVLAWNFKEEILKNNRHLLAKGVEFYFPIEVMASSPSAVI